MDDDMLILDDDEQDEFNPFLERDREIKITGDSLPHWQQDGKYIFVTFRLGDSLPQCKLDEIKDRMANWKALHPAPLTPELYRQYKQIFSNKIERYLDAGYGECILRMPEIARIMAEALQYYHLVRYQLVSYVIMPNHVHVLVLLLGNPDEDPASNDIAAIVESWKSFTAHAFNRILGRKGQVWMPKYYDRILRDEYHFDNVIAYIHKNIKHGGVQYSLRYS